MMRQLLFYKGEKMQPGSALSTDFHGYGEQIRKQVAGLIPKGGSLDVLDVGTGFGLNVEFLAEHLPEGSEIWTVDPSRDVLSKVKTAYAEKEWISRVHFVKASAHKLRFADGKFDLVVSVMVMHHIESLSPVLKELARVLKHDGKMAIVDYKPEAGRALEFHTRHNESDFFAPADVRRELTRLGMKAESKEFELWYLVKGSWARPRGGRRGRTSKQQVDRTGPARPDPI